LTDIRAKSLRPSGDWQMPSSTILEGSTKVMSWPSNMTWPRAGCIRPEMVRRVVVLPAPLDPISATISPLSTCRLTPWSAWTLP